MVAFIVMAFAASLSNLFVGISSALHGIPELSFGEIISGNVLDLTLAVALAILFTKGNKKSIPSDGKTTQHTSIFTLIAALLLAVLVLDGNLSRIDGASLIVFFVFYIIWLFSKRERFTKVFEEKLARPPTLKRFRDFMKDSGKVALGVILLLLAAEGIVRSATFFAEAFYLPLFLVGILTIGLGNSLPETYFAIVSAKRGETRMILGDLMGSVIVPTTLILGLVALIHPISVSNFSPFFIARVFLVIAILFFFFFTRTDKKITRREAVILLGIYLLFMIFEIWQV